LTKKQLKKLKQKQRKQDEVVVPKAAAKTMDDILFQPSTDCEEFKLQDLFTNAQLSEGLNRIPLSSALKITPQDLFTEISLIAKTRFDHQLPEQKKLSCLGSTLQKASLLRDLCKTMGV